jgi:hypothetical protein
MVHDKIFEVRLRCGSSNMHASDKYNYNDCVRVYEAVSRRFQGSGASEAPALAKKRSLSFNIASCVSSSALAGMGGPGARDCRLFGTFSGDLMADAAGSTDKVEPRLGVLCGCKRYRGTNLAVLPVGIG